MRSLVHTVLVVGLLFAALMLGAAWRSAEARLDRLAGELADEERVRANLGDALESCRRAEARTKGRLEALMLRLEIPPVGDWR